MQLLETYLNGVKLLKSPHFQDQRGVFLKAFSGVAPELAHYRIQQINYVESNEKHTIRGLHFQPGEHWESKFFRAVKGAIQLAFIDLRKDSYSFLKAASVILDHPEKGVLIPRGFATGYCTLSSYTTVLYCSDNEYKPEVEKGVRWDDPDMNIQWATQTPVVSEKDRSWKNVREELAD